jgi:hypothetical protein
MVAITYRRDLGTDLSADQVDDNFQSVVDAITALQNDRPSPNEIVSVTKNGLAITFNLANGSTLGPVDLPAVTFHFFDAWTPFTLYVELDTFVVDGVGIFTTMVPHTTGATFDPALSVGGVAAYRKLMGFAPDGGSSIIYDLEFQYQGRLSDAVLPPVNFIAPRKILVPAAGNQHSAYLVTPASTATQVLPILHDGSQFGTVTFAIGANEGAVVINADETILFRERLTIGVPGATDATAAGMTVALAAQRLIA